MKKTLLLFILPILLILSTQSAYCSQTNFERALYSWKGENISSFIDVWSYPTEEKTIAGRHLYIWKSPRVRKYSTYYYTYTPTSDSSSYEVYCDKAVEVDSNNIIKNLVYEGYCSMGKNNAMAMANPKNNYWLAVEKLHVQARLEKEQKDKLKAQQKLEKKTQKAKEKQLKKEQKENKEKEKQDEND